VVDREQPKPKGEALCFLFDGLPVINEEATLPRHIEHLSLEDQRVLTVQEAAKLNGLSWMTFKRLLKDGDGPQVVQLSPRRIGIRLIDNAKWQAARLRS
jgi:predicted DNA-binding transcriptional regulator AlpA